MALISAIYWLLGFAIVTALAASARGRSPSAWFFLGLLFPFGLIAVLVMRPRGEFGRAGSNEDDHRAPSAIDNYTPRHRQTVIVKVYKGIPIETAPDGNGVVAMGSHFPSVTTAERAIDNSLNRD